MLGSSPVRAGGFLRGRLRLREQAFQRPLSRVLLVLFLAKQEKNILQALIKQKAPDCREPQFRFLGYGRFFGKPSR